MITLQNIVKNFGPLRVLNGVSLTIPQGTRTILIGPSGGGKSTLLRTVNLLNLPDSGNLLLGDTSLEFTHSSSPSQKTILRARRKTGMIFQNFNLFPHYTALENVTEGLVTVCKWNKTDALKRGEELLQKVGILHKKDSYPATLSGGQQQRVAIARALAPSPEILLCDEPTSALDPELAGEVSTVLKNLAHEGITMLMATHDLRLAGSIANEVVFLEHGKIVESGAPKDIFGQPREDRTREFIASISGNSSQDSFQI